MKKSKVWTMAAVWLTSLTAGHAQEAETFSIATLNVDGLPQKILVAKVNPDGPGGGGSVRIGRYLQKRGYDLVMMQEDFNYHEELTVPLEDDYQADAWSGDVGVDGRQIDFLHLQNHRFGCDGLMGTWKSGITLTATIRTPWTANFGKFSHALDEMVTKGFRRYELTLRGGQQIVVYNMHMDAGDTADEREGKDSLDRDARLKQWSQLREDILARLDTRPVIVVGDLNSYYCRDQIKKNFIDAIEATGRAKVYDAWVELQNSGKYPDPVEGIVCCEADGNILESGEGLDKVLYVNPTDGTAIHAVSYQLDTVGYLHDGKMLGDHYPVAVTFQTGDRKTTGITTTNDTNLTNSDNTWYDLQGRRADGHARGIVIERDGEKTHKRIIK
jgi:endonuclease/exonuclease/phosphatase family metal-dependent hydrolase